MNDIREAYHTFCEFQRGKMIYDDELKQAMRIYMNEVDDLVGENAELLVNLSRAKQKCADERRLKRKYFEQLKAIKTDKEKFIQLLDEIGIKYELGVDTIYIDKFACAGAEEFGISFWDGEDYPKGSFHEFWVVPEYLEGKNDEKRSNQKS